MINEIKELYAQLDCKGGFIEMIAKDLSKSPRTVRVHWINAWSIPEKHQPRVRELLEETIKIQDKYRQEKENLISK